MNSIDSYFSKQLPVRQGLLAALHKVIVDNDKTVVAQVGKMMGKEMLIYHAPGTMKYALSSMKRHMSLHCLPIYGSAELHEKYRALLPLASFQKGCINFKDENELPLKIASKLIRDCSPIDLLKIREEYLKSKKGK